MPIANQPLWYRASVSGTAPGSLKIEYSADKRYLEHRSAGYRQRYTFFYQWFHPVCMGLAATNYDFYVDNISFNATPAPADITLSETALTSYIYTEGAGPPAGRSFTVAGSKLTNDLVITAPATFEISLNAATGFTNTITLPQNSGTLASTTIYVRLKAGLADGNYEGIIAFSYTTEPRGFDKVVMLRGAVSKPVITASVTSALTDLGYVSSGGPSVVRLIIVFGTTLSQNLEITAPVNFEVSLSSGSGYTTSLSLAPTNGTVAPTIIYIRMVSGLAANTYSGTVAVTSIGADSKNLALSGTVSAQAIVYASVTALSGFNYSTYAGIPPVRAFFVWEKPLAGDTTITAPATFEVLRTAANSYGTAIALGMNNGTVDSKYTNRIR